MILARGDTFTYFYPYWGVRDAALLSGHLPLWSPDLFMGVPLLANSQLGTFYPPNWILASLTPPDAIRVSILLHVAWAGIGTYLLARRSLGASRLAALLAGGLFAFGGHIGAHVEQINQLQGLAWLPWLIYLFDRALERPLPNAIWLSMGLALQFFSGHTQTLFITVVALAIYALSTRPIRGVITLACAGGAALVLALPQLIPTLELTRVSNRSGGLTLNQATAFSFSPFVTGRGLLPSYDSLIFAEYVAYPGVIGLGLAIIGALSARAGLKPAPTRRFRLPLSPRLRWLIMALAGLALAYGVYDPLYWLLGSLPGFDLFRVPARWLALFALGTAMLAALGIESLRVGAQRAVPLQITSWRSWRLGGSTFLIPTLIIAALAALSLLTLRQNDLTPVSLPTPITGIGWALALLVLLIGVWRRLPLMLAGAALLELGLASQIMPYNQLVPPDAASAQRFTESQLIAEQRGQTPSGRVLSISGLLFDPGDRGALLARYQSLGMSPDAIALAFDTVKLKETLGANLPLIWAIPSVDGYDGGLLPTTSYSAFTSLLLPGGERSIDGRLRELLAQPDCGGACIPDLRWLDLMNVRYLITDKVYDLVQDGVFYDTQFSQTAPATYRNPQRFTATAIDLLCQPCDALRIDGVAAPGEPVSVGDDLRLRFSLDPAAALDTVQISGDPAARIRAVTLVDTRTGDFQQLAPDPFTRILSSDIKLYQNDNALPRAFVVGDARFVSDDDAALDQLRDPSFDPAQTVVIAGQGEDPVGADGRCALQAATITAYTDTRVSISVNSPDSGYLVLTDAFYPGWTAAVNGVDTPVERADVMFRAVQVPSGESEVVFEYRPAWLPLAPILGGMGWIAALIAAVLLRRSQWRRTA